MRSRIQVVAIALGSLVVGSAAAATLAGRFPAFDSELHSRLSALDGVPLTKEQKVQAVALARAVKAIETDATDLKKTILLAGKVAGTLETAFPADAALDAFTTAMVDGATSDVQAHVQGLANAGLSLAEGAAKDRAAAALLAGQGLVAESRAAGSQADRAKLLAKGFKSIVKGEKLASKAPHIDAACVASLNPLDDGTGAARQALVLSEIAPGKFIEFFNATEFPIALPGVAYVLVNGIQVIPLSEAGAGITVAAHGFAAIAWPSSLDAGASGGEILLALDGSDIADGTRYMSFVCWGTNPVSSNQSTAEANGKWASAGSCPGPLANGSIQRLPSTAGTVVADFDVAGMPTPSTCHP